MATCGHLSCSSHVVCRQIKPYTITPDTVSVQIGEDTALIISSLQHARSFWLEYGKGEYAREQVAKISNLIMKLEAQIG